ncbi:hypothetical protein [Erythrobacter crassostreae]|uniref:Uncharacterized protein n=1 Tax=Erythrobacter crassostreae TaxID=2828328 RepID=A0A9X1JNY2_9SPHN|nr:hypothetical protein [Erythrobacter crassostrea]MBV7258862.1 hypothetical protein [Erythrobacter crassostrea]
MKIVQGLAGLTLGMVGGLLVIFFVLGGLPVTEAVQAEAPVAQAPIEHPQTEGTGVQDAETQEGGPLVRVSLKG